MKKQDVLDKVKNSMGSIFSISDVVRIIEMVDEGESRKITVSDIGTALDQAMNELSRNSDDVIDKHSAEFDITNGNEIYISDISFDFDFIRDTLEEYLMPLGEPDSEE